MTKRVARKIRSPQLFESPRSPQPQHRPASSFLFFACFLFGVVTLGCANSHLIRSHTGLRISSNDFRERFSTLCLFPFRSEIELEQEETKFAQLEEQLSLELERIAIHVVPTIEVEKVWNEARDSSGGYFDPHWGTVDSSRFQLVEENFLGDGLRKLQCDGVLYLSVVEVEAVVWNGSASWDHATDQTEYGLVGYLPALSLRIRIIDTRKNEVYFGAGGIHLSVEIDSDEYTDPHYKPIEEERNMAVDLENFRAIRFALIDLGVKMDDGD